TVTEDALVEIAQRAMKRETGARALRAVVDEIMLDFMYDLPDMDNDGAEYVLDRQAIVAKAPLRQIRIQRKESA
ncbi:MAG: ATP-dependent Clp protease ATP-binding subunit ClpX, partial [Planctomycetota bacterium]